MYNFLNTFLGSNLYNKIPKNLARKIFKIFKIFFVETKLKKLPENNHPTEIEKKQQINIINNSSNQFYKPFSTCSYLLEILAIYESLNKKINLLDFGANNIDNYIYLNKYIKNLKYSYHDMPNYNHIIDELISEQRLKNIKVVHDLKKIQETYDFTFFGSSIHYINNYKEILKKFIFKRTKYILISHTPFFKSNHKKRDIVMKQVNIFPIINYAYLLNYDNFILFMKQNDFELISQNKNNFIKFLNFKNFKNFNFIEFLDLIFVKKIVK